MNEVATFNEVDFLSFSLLEVLLLVAVNFVDVDRFFFKIGLGNGMLVDFGLVVFHRLAISIAL